MIPEEAREKYIDGIIMMAKNIGMSPSEFYAVCWSMCACVTLETIESVGVSWSEMGLKKK